MSRRVDTEADLGEVRHPIDEEKLSDYLVSTVPASFEKPLQLKQFGFGQSNPSYQITDAKGRKYVLRKQPPGKLLSKSAHRVDREFYMQKALGENTSVPVAEMIHLCTDTSVIGTMFYIMGFLNGRIFHETSIEGVSAKDRAELWLSVTETLASLHKVDPTKIGLPKSMTGKLSSHFPRQLKTLTQIMESQAKAKDEETAEELGPIPEFSKNIAWMQRHLPSNRVAIVHGDFKIDNLVFDPVQNKVIGILDWELCTIGHPLADLGNLLIAYGIPPIFRGKTPSFTLKEGDGLPTLEQQFSNYKMFSGYDATTDWRFALVYAYMRYAVITHGIAARYLQGQASSADAGQMGRLFKSFSEMASNEIGKDSKL